jgi:DNA-binding transcriptional regulator YiaG
MPPTTPDELALVQRIRALRARLGETTAAFGARFHRSRRTVEDWEQGRKMPDPLVVALIEQLCSQHER